MKEKMLQIQLFTNCHISVIQSSILSMLCPVCFIPTSFFILNLQVEAKTIRYGNKVSPNVTNISRLKKNWDFPSEN